MGALNRRAARSFFFYFKGELLAARRLRALQAGAAPENRAPAFAGRLEALLSFKRKTLSRPAFEGFRNPGCARKSSACFGLSFARD